MNTHAFVVFCPVCKLGIDANSVVCRHCGTILDLAPPGSKSDNLKDLTARLPNPLAGLAVYTAGTTTPIAVTEEKEFILGRESGGTEKVVDLTNLDGFAMGVSRRHAMVRAIDNSYILIDLNSSNGTWLNGQILVPTIIYELPSGSNIQLGHLKLVAIYNAASS